MESNEALEHTLPPVENSESISDKEQIAALQMEQPSSGSHQDSQQVTGQQVPMQPVQQFQQPMQTSPPTSYGSNMTISAEDVDLIEKAWVEKAKAIVRSTHGDPFTQNKELNKVKAEYIKTRFDKDIKVVE